MSRQPPPCRGIDVAVFAEKPDAALLCCACHLVANRPVQAPCGHHYCYEYVHQLRGATKCLESECDDGDTFQAKDTFEDRFAGRSILALKRVCPVDPRCSWRGALKDQDAHQTLCEYRQLKCSRCDVSMLSRELKVHEPACDKGPCKFHVVGCYEKVSKDKIKDHDKRMATRHCDMLLQACVSLDNSGRIDLPSSDDDDSNGGQVDGNRPDVSNASGGTSVASTLPPPEASLRAKLLSLKKQCQDSTPLAKAAAENLQKLVQDDLPLVHEEKARLFRRLEELNRQSQLKDSLAQTLQERFRNYELATFNGVCLFKVERFREQRLECIAGTQQRLFSHFFYTSPRGYRLRLACYLNGDGSGKENYISLFIIVCKHKFDAILQWPFRYRISLLCLNQEGGQHLKQSFHPDDGSPSFKRPESDFNVASGCPKFVELKKLVEPSPFLKDNTLLLKCVVDVPEGAD